MGGLNVQLDGDRHLVSFIEASIKTIAAAGGGGGYGLSDDQRRGSPFLTLFFFLNHFFLPPPLLRLVSLGSFVSITPRHFMMTKTK